MKQKSVSRKARQVRKESQKQTSFLGVLCVLGAKHSFFFFASLRLCAKRFLFL
jgi:hypothetical protein